MHCRVVGPLTCDPGRAAAVGAWPAGHAPLPACEANAMDRLPAPKHRRVESAASGPAPRPPWDDEPMGEGADGRLWPTSCPPPLASAQWRASAAPTMEDEPMEEGTDDSGGRISAPSPMPAPKTRRTTRPQRIAWNRPPRGHRLTSQGKSHALPGMRGTEKSSTRQSLPLRTCSIACSRQSVVHYTRQ